MRQKLIGARPFLLELNVMMGEGGKFITYDNIMLPNVSILNTQY